MMNERKKRKREREGGKEGGSKEGKERKKILEDWHAVKSGISRHTERNHIYIPPIRDIKHSALS